MKVKVQPKIETGKNRGGEDLYLLFRAVHKGTKPPVTEEIQVGLAAHNNYRGVDVEQLGLDELQPGDPGDTDDAFVFAPEVSFRYGTLQYDFEWVGKGSDVLTSKAGVTATVEQYLRNPENWRFCHKPGEKPKLVCSGSVYVDGNAD